MSKQLTAKEALAIVLKQRADRKEYQSRPEYKARAKKYMKARYQKIMSGYKAAKKAGLI